MKLRLISNALLLSAFSLNAYANDPFSLGREDFRVAQVMKQNRESLVSAKLSRSGKEKFLLLNRTALGKKVHLLVAGIASDMTLRKPIHGDELQVGPFSPEDAAKIVRAINQE